MQEFMGRIQRARIRHALNDVRRGDGVCSENAGLFALGAYRSQVRVLFRLIVAPNRIVALPQPEWALSPAAASFGNPGQIGADIVAFNTILHEEARAAGARYVDLYPLMHKPAEAKMLTGDGLHPSARAANEPRRSTRN